MSGPLDGVRVIDLTAMASGPFATQILGDQGADVIKVEPPGGGDPIRHVGTSRGGMSAVFANMNRNKRSLALDLRDEQGVDLLLRLAETADVFVQNFRPGVAERMGIGEAALRRASPRIVYVSISGYGETGPYAQYKVYDSVMQAFSGMAALQADPADGRPRFVRNIVCDKSTALTTAQAITAALYARERGAPGQHLRISMLDAAIAFLWPDGAQDQTLVGLEPRGAAASALTPQIRDTADGWLTFNFVQDHEFKGLARALERPDLLDDERFADPASRARNAAALHDLVNELTRTHATAELAARLRAEDVPFALVNRVEDLANDPQVVASGVLVESEHPRAGRMRTPRPVPQFERTPCAVRHPAPGLGEHSAEILAELGLDRAQIEALQAKGVLARP
jgi:crotonobetainyl-CoA:carnitine CoA-transferase CaiB-like acyl-CoA transferase